MLTKIIRDKKANFAVFDIKAMSKEDNKNLQMLGFYDGKHYRYFTSVGDFYDYLFLNSKKYRNWFIYSHYGGKHDMSFLFEEQAYASARGLHIKNIMNVGGRVIGFDLFSEKTTFHFADSYSLFNCSLTTLTKNFDNLHKKLDHDRYKDFILTEENIKYNENDCKGLYEALDIFYNKYAKGIGCTYTIASSAMKVFKKYFYDDEIKLFTLKQRWEKFIRQSYKGGRCEIFNFKMKGGYCYDINSLYPSVMLEKMPVDEYYLTTTRHKNKIGFFECEIMSENFDKPILAIKHNNKLMFMNGKFKGWFASCELDYFEKRGGKYKIIKGIEFEEQEPIFKDYIEYYYDLKVNAKNETDKQISKLFLNSLYGKFGERREKEALCFSDTVEMKDIDKYKIYAYGDDWTILSKESYSKSNHILPHISSYITALARIKLYELFEKVNLDVYYCDTDRIFTTTELPTSDKLCDVKLEYKVKHMTFKAPKSYFGRIITMDGKEKDISTGICY